MSTNSVGSTIFKERGANRSTPNGMPGIACYENLGSGMVGVGGERRATDLSVFPLCG